MIIRILGEGQYEIDSVSMDELNAIDNRIVDHVSKGSEIEYKKELSRMISMVKAKGKALNPSHISKSDLILPPEDLTIAEAKKIFQGEGLIKG